MRKVVENRMCMAITAVLALASVCVLGIIVYQKNTTLTCTEELFLKNSRALKLDSSKTKILDTKKVEDLEVCQYTIEVEAGDDREIVPIYLTQKYAIAANIIDVKTEESLTQTAIQKHRQVSPEVFQKLRALSSKTFGSGKNELVVFSDPECPFCEKLMETLAKHESEFTVHYVFYPLASHPIGQIASYQAICTESGRKRLSQLTSVSQITELKQDAEKFLKASKGQPAEGLCQPLLDRHSQATQILKDNRISRESVPLVISSAGKWITGSVPIEVLRKLTAAP